MLLSIFEIVFLIASVISVSLWEYIMFQTKTTAYPYREGFGIFSLIQWTGIGIGMISIFGLIKGVLALVFFMTLLQYICHFTLGFLWNSLAKVNYLFPTAIFSTMVLITLALGVLQIVF